jgi:hypothetical protein
MENFHLAGKLSTNDKDLEGNYVVFFKVLYRHLSGEDEENLQKISVRTVGKRAQILTVYLTSRSPERYHYANLHGDDVNGTEGFTPNYYAEHSILGPD